MSARILTTLKLPHNVNYYKGVSCYSYDILTHRALTEEFKDLRVVTCMDVFTIYRKQQVMPYKKSFFIETEGLLKL